MHLGRRAEKHAELAVALADGRCVDEADVGKSGADQLLGKALPVEPVMSVEVDLVCVEGAVGIRVEVRDAQPATVDEQAGHRPQQAVHVVHVVQRHRTPHHVVGPVETVGRQVSLDGVQSVTEPGRLDPLPGDLHHPGGRVRHDNRTDQVGEQDAQPARATTDVDSAHARAELHGGPDGPSNRDLPQLVAGVVVPRRCFVVEAPVFVHVIDPIPALSDTFAVKLSVEARRAVQVDLRELLAAVEDGSPVDVIDALGAGLARAVDARHVSLLIANFSGNALSRLSHVSDSGPEDDGRNERVESVPLQGTAHERALFTQTREVVRQAEGWLVLVPITERGDAIGILEVAFAHEPDTDVLDDLVVATHAWSYALIASRRHTDLFEWAQRDTPFSISAEIQRRLLPSAYTAEAGPLTVAGWLEPSHDVGGDTFDYCLDREYAYLSITDAMGHDVGAALLATLTVGTLRNRRRTAASPAEQADAANEALHTHAASSRFVTGLLVRIRLADGTAEVVDAGHPHPFLVRNGAVAALEFTTQLPLGLATAPYRADVMTLEPGDRLLLVTDGYLDRLDGRVDIEEILTRTVDRHPRQIVHELARTVREVTGDELRDDATALCMDWYGAVGMRDATGGASRARTTPAS